MLPGNKLKALFCDRVTNIPKKIPLYFNPFNRHTFSSIMKRDSFTKESLGVVVVNVLKKYVKMISLHMT